MQPALHCLSGTLKTVPSFCAPHPPASHSVLKKTRPEGKVSEDPTRKVLYPPVKTPPQGARSRSEPVNQDSGNRDALLAPLCVPLTPEERAGAPSSRPHCHRAHCASHSVSLPSSQKGSPWPWCSAFQSAPQGGGRGIEGGAVSIPQPCTSGPHTAEANRSLPSGHCREQNREGGSVQNF